jgi:hypothetical protein
MTDDTGPGRGAPVRLPLPLGIDGATAVVDAGLGFAAPFARGPCSACRARRAS